MLDKNEFKDWLNAKHTLEVVGVSGNMERCPLSNYLLEKHDFLYASVTENNLRYMSKDQMKDVSTPLPPWALQFVADIDDRKSGSPIRVWQCFLVLE